MHFDASGCILCIGVGVTRAVNSFGNLAHILGGRARGLGVGGGGPEVSVVGEGGLAGGGLLEAEGGGEAEDDAVAEGGGRLGRGGSGRRGTRGGGRIGGHDPPREGCGFLHLYGRYISAMFGIGQEVF